MAQLSLFDSDADRTPEPARRLAAKLARLADRGIYFGTSSWKYEGWIGSIYARERYVERGRFSKKRFESGCLEEYGRTFPVVGGDFSFYQFPSPEYWKTLFEKAPPSLRFGLKVPEEITVVKWPGHSRYGERAGKANHGFLDNSLFQEMFAEPLKAHAGRIAVLMLEFGTFSKSSFATAADFLERLETFLASASGPFRYAVEIRNADYLGPEYFAVLRRHNAAHVFNAWTRMPDLIDQVEMPGAFTADFSVARALLKRGRAYEDAVKLFQPYERVQEVNAGAREGLRRIAERAWKTKQPAYTFVNNRLEGFAPGTIEAVADTLED
ncbi:hypothetical protein OJF2_56350 [Aquisphaera giovannonii]|uniref:DUF72 domain-containing protein n=1 Tax=Aquisphaera giovannonii TaxID=406548 RepID=A0A5B9WAZ4_9BACT|nr:DUF72 domain-containing protein [Aquisphaera giovannonii]QEH37050.1 hypothetical protein OJF2_56350 [Aquisphaera giovannonii]